MARPQGRGIGVRMFILDNKWNALLVPLSVFSGPPPDGYKGWNKSAVSYYIHGLLVREHFDLNREIYSRLDQETNGMIFYQEAAFSWDNLKIDQALN